MKRDMVEEARSIIFSFGDSPEALSMTTSLFLGFMAGWATDREGQKILLHAHNHLQKSYEKEKTENGPT